MIRRAVIVDSGLRGLGGHNYTYSMMMVEALRQRGISTRVVGSRHLDPGLREQGVEPGFSIGVGHQPERTDLLRMLRFLSDSARRFADEVKALLGPDLEDPDTLVFSHTLAEFEVMAWSELAPALKCSLAILVRQTPVYQAMPFWKRSLHPYFRAQPVAARTLRRAMGERFCLLADGEALARDLAAGFGIPCTHVPVPVDPEVLPAAGPPSSAPAQLTLGYLGDARGAKGFQLLPALISRVLAARDVRFLIQCPPARGGETDAQREIERLKQLRPLYGDRLTLIEERLTREGYRTALSAMDIVLVPYTAPQYLYSTSGVFAEAAAAGKPTVAPAPSWMNDELKARGAGIVYARGDSEALNAATLSAIDQLGVLSDRARRSAASCRAYYSARTVIETLFGALGRGSGRMGDYEHTSP